MNNKQGLVLNVLYALTTLAAIAFAGIIMYYRLLPENYRYIFFAGLILLYLLIGLYIVKVNKKSTFYISGIILLLLLTGQVYGGYNIYNTYTSFDNTVKESESNKLYFSVITRADNTVNSISELNDDTIYFDEGDLSSELLEVEKQIEEVNPNLKLEASDNIVLMVDQLLNNEIDYLIMNSAKKDIVNDNIENFESKIKELIISGDSTDVVIEKEVEEVVKPVEAGENFNILISGTDSNRFSDSARSDVNMIVSFNQKENKILMTSIPRDSYANMPEYGKDKLTHAGVYGISTLISTVEELLDTEINYYIKVNFASLEDIIDTLGGITVNNEKAFTSVIGKYRFEKGSINLDGKKALAYVRERKAFADGDFARGRNQMKVLSAMIDKALSPTILLNYGRVLDTSLKAVRTNLPTEKITEIINSQVENRSAWSIEQNQIQGEPVMGLHSYAMPGYKLSFIELNQNSLREAKEKIEEVIEK